MSGPTSRRNSGVELCSPDASGPGKFGARAVDRKDIVHLTERTFDGEGAASRHEIGSRRRRPWSTRSGPRSAKGAEAGGERAVPAPLTPRSMMLRASRGHRCSEKHIPCRDTSTVPTTRVIGSSTALAKAVGEHDFVVMDDDIVHADGRILIDPNDIVRLRIQGRSRFRRNASPNNRVSPFTATALTWF